jgi:hypothetical protein
LALGSTLFGGPGAEIFKKVAEVKVVEACTEFDIQGLSINDAKFYLMVYSFYNPTGSSSWYQLYANDDTVATNYYTQLGYLAGTSVSASRSNGSFFAYGFTLQRSSGYGILLKDVDNRLRCEGKSNYFTVPSISTVMYTLTSVNAFSNITKLKIRGTIVNSIGIGSKVILYGGV